MRCAMAYEVPGMRVVLAQPSSMACWATVYTMMISWKRQSSYDIATAVGGVGARYLKIFQANTGLPAGGFGPFMKAAGMACEPMMNPMISRWEQLLKRYGLLS